MFFSAGSWKTPSACTGRSGHGLLHVPGVRDVPGTAAAHAGGGAVSCQAPAEHQGPVRGRHFHDTQVRCFVGGARPPAITALSWCLL